MIAAKRLEHVYSFEPQTNTYSTLITNLQSNSITEKVKAFQIALCDRTRIDKLNMSSIESGNSYNTFGGITNQFGTDISNYSYYIMGYTIDDFIQIFKPVYPTHIKIDVDGIEERILVGGRKTFNSEILKSVVIETEGSKKRINENLKIMMSYNFKIRKQEKNNQNTFYDRI